MKKKAYCRDGESLKPLNQSKQEEIGRQIPEPDWSAENQFNNDESNLFNQ